MLFAWQNLHSHFGYHTTTVEAAMRLTRWWHNTWWCVNNTPILVCTPEKAFLLSAGSYSDDWVGRESQRWSRLNAATLKTGHERTSCVHAFCEVFDVDKDDSQTKLKAAYSVAQWNLYKRKYRTLHAAFKPPGPPPEKQGRLSASKPRAWASTSDKCKKKWRKTCPPVKKLLVTPTHFSSNAPLLLQQNGSESVGRGKKKKNKKQKKPKKIKEKGRSDMRKLWLKTGVMQSQIYDKNNPPGI